MRDRAQKIILNMTGDQSGEACRVRVSRRSLRKIERAASCRCCPQQQYWSGMPESVECLFNAVEPPLSPIPGLVPSLYSCMQNSVPFIVRDGSCSRRHVEQDLQKSRGCAFMAQNVQRTLSAFILSWALTARSKRARSCNRARN